MIDQSSTESEHICYSPGGVFTACHIDPSCQKTKDVAQVSCLRCIEALAATVEKVLDAPTFTTSGDPGTTIKAGTTLRYSQMIGCLELLRTPQ